MEHYIGVVDSLGMVMKQTYRQSWTTYLIWTLNWICLVTSWNSLLWSITSASLTASGWLWNKRIGKVEQHTSFERVIATKLSFVGRAKISHPSFHDYHDLSLSWRRLALDKRGWGRLNENRVFRCLWHLFMSREDEDDVRDIGKHDFRSVLLHPVLSANAHRWRTEPFHKFPIELWVYKTSNTE